MILYVQFKDDTESEVVSYFMCKQNPEFYQFLGEIDTSDERWKKYYESLPPYAQELVPESD